MNKPLVLTVDDSADDVTLLQFACSAARVSFQLQQVESGDLGIAYLKGCAPFADRLLYPLPDLVLLDIKMPGKSGFDVLSWARSQPDLHMPIIVFSASMHDADRAKALQLGATEYIVKPVSYQLLQRFVEHIEERLLQTCGRALDP